jgi:hypothetical protein
MTARELFKKSDIEITEHFIEQGNYHDDSLGLDIKTIYYRQPRILKKTETIVVLSPRRFFIYYRDDDKDAYIRIRISYNPVTTVEISWCRCKNTTGVIIGGERII